MECCLGDAGCGGEGGGGGKVNLNLKTICIINELEVPHRCLESASKKLMSWNSEIWSTIEPFLLEAKGRKIGGNFRESTWLSNRWPHVSLPCPT